MRPRTLFKIFSDSFVYIIKKGNLELEGSKRELFFKELRGLIGIFFAVVIGFGFNQFNVVDTSLFSQLAALIIICLSWWGYFYGIIVGPKELNVWNIIIDCFLLAVYWLLLNKHEYHLYLYPLMYFLYFIWEQIRVLINSCPEEHIILKRARNTNLFFFLFVCCVYAIIAGKLEEDIQQPWVVCIILLIAGVYRYTIHSVYSRKKEKEANYDDLTQELISEAKRVATHAITPISNYKVGAAILSSNGCIYTGCNIEFHNFSNTIHAEEAAIAKMASYGNARPIKIAVFTEGSEPIFPCGMCLQSLFELGGNELEVIACCENISWTKRVKELLPFGFSLKI